MVNWHVPHLNFCFGFLAGPVNVAFSSVGLEPTRGEDFLVCVVGSRRSADQEFSTKPSDNIGCLLQSRARPFATRRPPLGTKWLDD